MQSSGRSRSLKIELKASMRKEIEACTLGYGRIIRVSHASQDRQAKKKRRSDKIGCKDNGLLCSAGRWTSLEQVIDQIYNVRDSG